MPFDRGIFSIARLKVEGDAPKTVEQSTLDTLHDHRFRESDLIAPDEVEMGFITSEHLFDVDFSYEKCGFGSRMLFAVRLDTHKVPADVSRAYRRINEQAARDGSPTGHASKAELAEARDLAGRQVREDAASGKFRRSKSVSVLWDLAASQLWIGQTSPTIHEHIARLMHEAFGVRTSPISAGTVGGDYARNHGRQRDFEDAHPSKFTAPPPFRAAPSEGDEDDEPTVITPVPSTPWTQKSVDLKDFLGNEAVIWAWYESENSEEPIATPAGPVQLVFDPILEMECAWGVTGKQTLKGDGPTRLPEAAKALSIGKWPRKVGLLLNNEEKHWALSWQADRHLLSTIRLPEPDESVSSPREVIEVRLADASELMSLIDGLMAAFLSIRLSDQWAAKRTAISQWIKERASR